MRTRLYFLLAVVFALCSTVTLVLTFLFFDIAGRWFAIAFVLCQALAMPCVARCVPTGQARVKAKPLAYAPLTEDEIRQLLAKIQGVR